MLRFLTKNVRHMGFHYPKWHRDDSVVDILHSTEVPDPYRWLENPDSPETTEFVRQQNEMVQNYLANSTIRANLKEKLTAMYNYPKYSCPFKKGEFYYYFYNSGLQQQSALYRQSGPDQEPTLFFDPNLLSEDGTVSLSTFSFSESGSLFAYALSESGSDWTKIHVRYTDDSRQVNEVLEYVKFSSIAWTHDDQGFFYNRYPPPGTNTTKLGTETDSNSNPAVYYHRLGTNQSEDLLVFRDQANPDHMFGFEVSFDGKFFVLEISESCDPRNKLLVCPIEKLLSKPNVEDFVVISDSFKAKFSYLTNDGDVFYLQTTLDAPLERVVKFDLSQPEKV
jgi:prolyl oligopeptidase